MIKNALLAATAMVLLAGCFGSDKPKKWTSYIYPDKNNTKRSMDNGIFDSLEQCQEASLNKLQMLKLDTRGDYRCGLDCEYHEGMKTQICKEMKK